ncbi:hypothetical protein BYT27DRAFT_7334580 [Phlegmacium glaucopus]|nr:hypothetical protein BYT27DRAFT_7334580 [Phlegmacium glaucopus]
MTSHQSTVKRNKCSKNKSSLCEDDDDAVDSVTYEVVTRGGPVTKRIKVPMRPVPKEPSISTEVPQTPTSFIFEPRCEEPPEESFIPPKHNKFGDVQIAPWPDPSVGSVCATATKTALCIGDEHGYALPTGIALLSPCRPSSCYVAPLITTSPLSSLRRPSHRYVTPLVAMSPL